MSVKIRKLDCDFNIESSSIEPTFSITPKTPKELKLTGFAAFRVSENKLCKLELPRGVLSSKYPIFNLDEPKFLMSGSTE